MEKDERKMGLQYAIVLLTGILNYLRVKKKELCVSQCNMKRDLGRRKDGNLKIPRVQPAMFVIWMDI